MTQRPSPSPSDPSSRASVASVVALEAALSAAGVSVARLCRRADISQSTWHRWKVANMTPRGGTWNRLMAALAELSPALAERFAAPATAPVGAGEGSA